MTSIAINETHNTIDAENLPVITHNSIPVVTTELLAEVYGTEIKNIQMNHARNSERFVIGKHFFKLEGIELKEFKNRPTNSGSVAKRARSLILWTERGAARHAKMLDTDKAWDVFEKLEDCYFSQKDATPATASVKTSSDDRTPLRKAVSFLVGRKKMIYKEAYELVHHRFNVNHIDELPIEQLPAAVEYVHKLALEGEYLGKQQELSAPSKIQFTDDELCSLCWLWRNAVEMVSSISDVYPILRAAEHRLAGKYHSMSHEYPRNMNAARRLLERETAHIECASFTGSDWGVLNSLRLGNLPF